jgi:hypothetical protein
MAPSADCAEARPFHCDSGSARTTAKDASLTAAIAMAFAIFCSLSATCCMSHARAPETTRLLQVERLHRKFLDDLLAL